MKLITSLLMAFTIGFAMPIMSLAQDETPPSAVEKSESDQKLADEIQKDLEETFSSETPVIEQDQAPATFLGEVLDVIEGFGGVSTVLQISIIIMLIISSMKVSLLRDLIWDRIGALKAWIPPLLGLVAGLLGLYGEGDLTLASALAYMSAGAGAIILHELLNTVKAVPGIGPVYVQIIDLIQLALRPKKSKT